LIHEYSVYGCFFDCLPPHHLARIQTRARGGFFRHPTLLPPPPPPLRPNASRRWLFSAFRHGSHHCHLPYIQMRAGGGPFRLFRRDSHHHLPRVQTRAGGGPFRRFDTTPTTTYQRFNTFATTTTSLSPKREPEMILFSISTRIPPPPPSCPNASRRWSISAFRRTSHHHLLPRVQMRARGGPFCCFDVPPTTTTSLASKRELEVVLFGGFKASAAAATSPPPANRQQRKWIRGGEADKRNVGRASRMIGRDTRKEGQGVNDDLLIVVPQSSRQCPPLSFVRGFLVWLRRRGGVYTTHHPIRFFSLSVVHNMYLGYNTIKIVSTTPRSTTRFFQRLHRGPGKF